MDKVFRQGNVGAWNVSRSRDGVMLTLLRVRRGVEWRIVNHWANLRVPSRSVCRGVHLNKNDSRASGYVGTEQGAKQE